MRGPLEGIRVVEACQMVSGPLATMLLADQGAEVVKLETADGIGDRFRHVGTRHRGMGAAFGSSNRGKRSVVLDLKDERGREAAHALVAGADVFVQNFRPGAAERIGLGETELRAVNTDLVYVSISGFGPDGPYADQMVYDFVIQALTGMADLQRDRADRPDLVKNIAIDKATAYTVAQAITAALLARERGAGGTHVRVSMIEVGLAFFWPDGMVNHTFLGDDVRLAAPLADTYEVRATKDGDVALLANGNRTWPRLCAALEPAWLEDPRFATYEDRMRNGAELAAAVDVVLARLTTDEVIERLRANDLPGAAVTGIDDVHLDPQVEHLGAVVETDWPGVGPVRQPVPAARFADDQLSAGGVPPRYGEHTEEVLGELGWSGERIESMRADGVLGPTERGR
ncbi:MAG: CoA transferase [Actinomycetota bacterium]